MASRIPTPRKLAVLGKLARLCVFAGGTLGGCTHPTTSEQRNSAPAQGRASEPRAAAASRQHEPMAASTHVAPAPATGREAQAKASELLVLPRPTRTRAGSLRFADPALENPRMAALLLERLADRRLDPQERAALVEALPRTGGAWQGEILARYADEPDASVRQMMVAIMRRAEPEVGEAGVLLGLADLQPAVRAEAATTASLLKRHTVRGQAAVSAALLTALRDSDAWVRAGAARSLGVLGNSQGFDEIVDLLGDPAVEVRLYAVGALGRLDPAKARTLTGLRALAQDADPRVARAVRAVLETHD